MAARPTLLLLPGLMCDHAVWTAQVEAFSASHECIVPRYGTLASLGAMAEQVLDEAPPGPLAVAGHSMGGRVAFEMWARAPQRISHLALLDTSWHPLPPGAEGERERAGRYALLAIARTQGLRAMAREWAQGMVHPSRLGTPLFDAVLDMFERSSVGTAMPLSSGPASRRASKASICAAKASAELRSNMSSTASNTGVPRRLGCTMPCAHSRAIARRPRRRAISSSA